MSSVEGTMPLPKRYADVPPHAAGRGSRVAGRGLARRFSQQGMT